MKKILTFLMIICVMMAGLTFSGCMGFFEEEVLTVESISNELLPDGRTKITIKYVDDIKEPDIFFLPKGDKGEVGKDGNGIKKITIGEPDELTGVYTITIEFTDENLDPISYEVKNGVSVEGVVNEKDEVTGQEYIVFKYSNGETSQPIYLPKGADGNGISGYTQEVQEDGSVKFTLQFDNGETYDLIIPAGKQGNGISQMISMPSEDGTKYIIQIVYTNGDTQNIEFDAPEKPNTWLNGNGEPGQSQGKTGDFYYDYNTQSIYLKKDNGWMKVLDLDQEQVYHKVTFDLNDGDSEEKATAPDLLPEYKIRHGKVFKDEGYTIPVPMRAGYKFMGWYTARVVNPTIGCLTTVTAIYSDYTFYAIWEKIA